MVSATPISGRRACRETRGSLSTPRKVGTRSTLATLATWERPSRPSTPSTPSTRVQRSVANAWCRASFSDQLGLKAGSSDVSCAASGGKLDCHQQAGQRVDLGDVRGIRDSVAHANCSPDQCAFCKYPCTSQMGASDEGERCRISGFLEDWHAETVEKPVEFDRFYHATHASGFETAVVSFGGRQGSFWKSENQDAFFVVPIHDANDDAAKNPMYAVGVFDGHGQNGGMASRVVSDTFARKIESFVKLDGGRLLSERKLNERLVEILFEHTAEVMDEYPVDFEKSGTTAVVCVVSPDMVTGGWVGDSRAVVGLRDVATPHLTTVIPLTRDHKPDPIRNPEEAQRVVEGGGRVDRLSIDQQGRPAGPYRVFLKDRWVPGLAVSRAFGDYIVRDAGVISKPDINSLMLGGKRDGDAKRVVILGTDGLWEWISNEDAMRLACRMPNAHEAANALAEAAIKNWALYSQGKVCDDVTVAVVFV